MAPYSEITNGTLPNPQKGTIRAYNALQIEAYFNSDQKLFEFLLNFFEY